VEQMTKFVLSLLSRATSRSFVVAVAVIWFIATHPEITVEQLIGLLVGAGIVNARAIAEDRVELRSLPQGDAE